MYVSQRDLNPFQDGDAKQMDLGNIPRCTQAFPSEHFSWVHVKERTNDATFDIIIPLCKQR